MAQEQGAGGVIISDFPGLVNNSDARDIPPGASSILVNLCARQQGNLQTRGGLKPISFEAISTVDTGPRVT